MVAPMKQNKKSVVRKGPLCAGFAMLFVIPLFIMSVLNTQLEHKSSTPDHWGPRRIQQSFSGGSPFSWSNNKGTCPKYDSVQVILTNQHQELWWFPTTSMTASGSGDSNSTNVPLVDVWKMPIRPKDTPFVAAERLFFARIGQESSPSLRKESTEDGQVPPAATDRWTFLGETPNSIGCGSSVYSYIFRQDGIYPRNTICLSTVETWKRIRTNQMASISALATATLALTQTPSAIETLKD